MAWNGSARLVLVTWVLALVVAACGGGQSQATAKADVKVGLIYSKTGLLASYGAQYIEGFNAGLAYATNGTGIVNGHKIVVTEQDDAGDPAKAVSAAKDLIGQGFKILAGSTSSGVATQVAPIAEQNQVLFISGPAATDAITGINHHTFRSGRQTYQDILTAKAILGGSASGKKVIVFAQDSAFGKANVAAVTKVLGGEGATVDKILVPLTANDFTSFALQAKQATPDLLFVAWAGTTAQSMWQSLDQQGVFASATIVTGLDQRASYSTFGPVAAKIQFLSHYVYQAPNNAANTALINYVKSHGGSVPDLFDPDGFTAAEMIVHAVDKADGDASVDKLISALEGYSFLAPKGQETVRAQDHAMLQPMFIVKLQQSGAGYDAVLVKTLTPDEVAPPTK
jgi:branched-chain amino acid transport system substrate-binding protein